MLIESFEGIIEFFDIQITPKFVENFEEEYGKSPKLDFDKKVKALKALGNKKY